MSYTINDISKITGLSKYTLRYYEKINLITINKEGKNRIYSNEDLEKILYIISLKNLNFSLEDIKYYSKLKSKEKLTINERTVLLKNQLIKIEKDIKRLNEIKCTITKKINCIQGGDK